MLSLRSYIAQDYPQQSISTALVLDDCTADNGPLIMWPGSHAQHRMHDSNMDLGGAQDVHHDGELVDLEKSGSNPIWRSGPDPVVDPAVGQDQLVKAGSILHFSILTVHNSRPNNTDDPRRLMIYTHHPESFNCPADLRNGPSRLREAPYEREYLQACIDGKPGTRRYSLSGAQQSKL